MLLKHWLFSFLWLPACLAPFGTSSSQCGMGGHDMYHFKTEHLITGMKFAKFSFSLGMEVSKEEESDCPISLRCCHCKEQRSCQTSMEMYNERVLNLSVLNHWYFGSICYYSRIQSILTDTGVKLPFKRVRHNDKKSLEHMQNEGEMA